MYVLLVISFFTLYQIKHNVGREELNLNQQSLQEIKKDIEDRFVIQKIIKEHNTRHRRNKEMAQGVP